MATLFILKAMALSTRTYIREKEWTKLIRNLPEGANEMPLRFRYPDYHSLKSCCFRESHYETEFNYIPSFKSGVVTVTKIRKIANGESD